MLNHIAIFQDFGFGFYKIIMLTDEPGPSIGGVFQHDNPSQTFWWHYILEDAIQNSIRVDNATDPITEKTVRFMTLIQQQQIVTRSKYMPLLVL